MEKEKIDLNQLASDIMEKFNLTTVYEELIAKSLIYSTIRVNNGGEYDISDENMKKLSDEWFKNFDPIQVSVLRIATYWFNDVADILKPYKRGKESGSEIIGNMVLEKIRLLYGSEDAFSMLKY